MFRQRGATVDFQGDIKAFSAFRFPADSLIGYILMGMVHPVCPACAEGPAVDKKYGFTAGIQVQDNPFPAGFLRDGKTAEHPGIIPGHAPGGSGRKGRARVLFSLPQGQGGGRGKTFQDNFTQRVIQV